MSSTPEHTLWIDLETTDSDETRGHIIEIGAILCSTSPQMPIVREWSIAVKPPERWNIQDSPEVVQDMHFANGLWQDCLKSNNTIANADQFIYEHCEKLGIQKMALAGSGVAHFDGRWIRKFMPQTAGMLTYWAYDVGVLRRTAKLIGLPMPDLNEQKTHRAIDDIRLHREEFIWWTDKMATLP